MNIREAALIVKDGLLVKRSGWPNHKFMGLDSFGLFVGSERENVKVQIHFSISVDDLLAEDWSEYKGSETSQSQSGLRLKIKK